MYNRINLQPDFMRFYYTLKSLESNLPEGYVATYYEFPEFLFKGKTPTEALESTSGEIKMDLCGYISRIMGR